MIQALQLLLSLSILVVLHEFGHYITAKMFGCRVEKFYLFMDWPIALFKKKIGETEFGVGCAPLGGYVKISGMFDESMDKTGFESEPEPWELRAKPAWQRLIVMLGGIVVNVILAWVIYSVVVFCWNEKFVPMESLKDGFSFSTNMKQLGFEDGDKIISIDGDRVINYDPMFLITSILFKKSERVVVERGGGVETVLLNDDVRNSVISNLNGKDYPPLSPRSHWDVVSFLEGSVAKNAGMEIGDRIIAINDTQTPYYSIEGIEELVKNKENTISIMLERSGKTRIINLVLPETGKMGVLSSTLNAYEIQTVSYSFFESFSRGFVKTKEEIDGYWAQIKMLMNPQTGGYKQLGGLGTIGGMFDKSWNWELFWIRTAFLSIILAIMNLLPIPALDGGHALLALIEMTTGKKIPLKILMPLQVIGMIILIALMLYANGMDVVRWLNL